MNKGTKYYTFDGINFRSNDEIHYYKYLIERKAKDEIMAFEYEASAFILQPKFDFNGEHIRPITYTPDFIVYHCDGTIEYVEIKGHLTNEAVLKVKMFKYLIRNEQSKYTMLCRSLKYGDSNGWILFNELQKKRRANKRVGAKSNETIK